MSSMILNERGNTIIIHLLMTITWMFTLIEPIEAGSSRTNLPPLRIYLSDSTLTSHLHIPISLMRALVKFSRIISGPFSRLYLKLSTIVVPSGAVQVMVA